MEETDAETGLTPRAARALVATQPWANFAGIAAISVALLAVVRGIGRLYRLPGALAAGMHGHATAVYIGGVIAGTLWVAGFNGVLGWLALRYGGALAGVARAERPPAAAVVCAFRLQHRFWRVQGILWAVVMALLVLGVAAASVVLLALHR